MATDGQQAVMQREETEQTAGLPTPASSETVRPSWAERMKAHLMVDVDADFSTLPLSAFCFMTGFVSDLSIAAEIAVVEQVATDRLVNIQRMLHLVCIPDRSVPLLPPISISIH